MAAPLKARFPNLAKFTGRGEDRLNNSACANRDDFSNPRDALLYLIHIIIPIINRVSNLAIYKFKFIYKHIHKNSYPQG